MDKKILQVLARATQTAYTVAVVAASFATFISEWVKAKLEPTSYCIQSVTQQNWFVVAHRVRIDRKGRLVFIRGIRIIAVIESGTWIRFQRGLTQEDFNAE